MSGSNDPAETLSDICVLYELALAAGDFLDLRKNCEHFLSTLLSRKGFASAAVWLLAEALPDAATTGLATFSAAPRVSGLALVYGAPRVQMRERALPLSHPLWQRLSGGRAYSVADGDPTFAPLVTETEVHGGVFAVFPLADIGFLKVHARNRRQPLDDVELSQIGTVVRKFASSLQGCIAHEKLRRESAERERAQRERQAIAEELQQAQKMEAVGRLAGGIAHDFNNLLVAVLGNAELLLQEVHAGSHLREDVQAIVTAAQRAAHLTKQLLTFSRKDKRQFTVVRPDGLVEEVMTLFKRTLDPKVRLVLALGLADRAIRGDSAQLHTAVLNLALNARDAMPDGGTLTLSSGVVASPPGLGEDVGGPWARLSVADTGVGMSEEVAARVFEPFFTTKNQGRGTGLGLATVYGIVKSHGGRIALETAPRQGTRFDVFLPLCEPGTPVTPLEAPGEALRGGGLVLLVDDDHDSRGALARLIRALGYRVIEAEDGPTALRLAENDAARFVAMVLDLRMPGMNGAETLRHMRVLAPSLPVVAVSGFVEAHEVHTLEALGVRSFLAKPFSLRDLGRALLDPTASRPLDLTEG